MSENEKKEHQGNDTIVSNAQTAQLNISEGVIGSIIALAASEIDGIYGFSGSITSDIGEFFGKKSPGKGVKVVKEDEKLILDISIIVKFGYEIPDIAKVLQERVRENVEMMTGYDVLQVNIYVDGVEY